MKYTVQLVRQLSQYTELEVYGQSVEEAMRKAKEKASKDDVQWDDGRLHDLEVEWISDTTDYSDNNYGT